MSRKQFSTLALAIVLSILASGTIPAWARAVQNGTAEGVAQVSMAETLSEARDGAVTCSLLGAGKSPAAISCAQASEGVGAPLSKATKANGMKTFTSKDGSISFSYPDSLTLYTGNEIRFGSHAVLFTREGTHSTTLAALALPQDSPLEQGTNLEEAFMSVSTSNDPAIVTGCNTRYSGETDSNGNPEFTAIADTATINGTKFYTFSTSNAGAGNYYSDMVYRTVKNGACYEIDVSTHATDRMNYDPSHRPAQFDASAVAALFNQVVQSVSFGASASPAKTSSSSCNGPDQVVNIPDANLKAAIEKQLGISSSPTCAQMKK
jgi:hypothetical protein